MEGDTSVMVRFSLLEDTTRRHHFRVRRFSVASGVNFASTHGINHYNASSIIPSGAYRAGCSGFGLILVKWSIKTCFSILPRSSISLRRGVFVILVYLQDSKIRAVKRTYLPRANPSFHAVRMLPPIVCCRKILIFCMFCREIGKRHS